MRIITLYFVVALIVMAALGLVLAMRTDCSKQPNELDRALCSEQ
jgi:hypothetical protein